MMAGIRPTDRFFVQERIDELADEDDVMWSDMPQDLIDFIKDSSYTSGQIRSEIVDDIVTDGLGARVKEQEELLRKMEKDNQVLQTELQRQQLELQSTKASKAKAVSKVNWLYKRMNVWES